MDTDLIIKVANGIIENSVLGGCVVVLVWFLVWLHKSHKKERSEFYQAMVEQDKSTKEQFDAYQHDLIVVIKENNAALNGLRELMTRLDMRIR